MSKTTKPEIAQCRMCLNGGRIFYNRKHYPCPYCKTKQQTPTEGRHQNPDSTGS